MKYEGLKQKIKEAAKEFSKLERDKPIRLISHLDSDGITACSIIIKALSRQNRKYSISIIQQLDETVINQLSKENYDYVIFTDIGSGQRELMKDKLKNKKIFIFDHHTPDATKESENTIHVNPHLFGIDGSREISGAGIVYMFAKELDSRNKDMAHIAIIGAIGDVQEDHGFLKLNNAILEEAKQSGQIKVITGLRIFGAQTKPLHKVLEHSTEHLIPGVTGSESGAIQFLQQIGIKPKNGNEWKRLIDLTNEELKKLITGVVLKRLDQEKPEAVVGPVYILCNEDKASPTRDAKEFSTLLNACGRLGKASLGIGACLNNEKIKKKAIQNMLNYRKELVKAINWYEENKENENVIRGKNYIIINAQDNIRATIIGTLASIITKSNNLKQGTFLLSMARMLDGNTKASLRVVGNKNYDLMSIMNEIATGADGKSGGHKDAAGAIIKTEKENDFLQAAKDVFKEMK